MWSIPTVTVTVAEISELRAGGLSEDEAWAILCQASHALQDLFLSEEKIRGRMVPLVSPNNLGISSKGRVLISVVDEIRRDDEEFLAPEYAGYKGRDPEDADWEKMWVYSLGKTILSSLKVATKKTCSLVLVLRFMTKEDPSARASLMSLLNIISEHWKTNLPVRPFSHLVMDMYREVFGAPPQCLSPPDTADPINMTKARIHLNGFVPLGSGSPSSDSAGKPKPCSRTSSTAGSLDSGNSRAPPKRNPVQRAPSRLYRGPAATETPTSGGDRASPPNACTGPEFVVRGSEPAKVVHVGDAKASQRRALTVVLLTGQRVQLTCDPHGITCGKVLEVLVKTEWLEDNYLFGLACLINGDFVFIPSEMKLHKVAPAGWRDGGKKPDRPNFLLYLRVKFFLPSLRGIKSSTTKHSMYLQLRRSVLEQQVKCEFPELLVLGGLALQAEFGNYDDKEHGTSSYFLLEHYLPEDVIDERLELESRLQELHKSRFGLEPCRAEELFIAHVQKLPEYGSHHYTALWVRKSVTIPMWVTVNPQGVYLYEKKKSVLDRKIHEAFVWKNIQGLSCNENYFRIVPHDVGGQKVTGYKMRLDGKKSFFLFRLASFHHQFFLKLRVELSPLHALSHEFGIPLRKEGKKNFYVEKRGKEEWAARREAYLERNEKKMLAACGVVEELQNKENENPTECNRKEKRIGVKMGVRAFQIPPHKETPDRFSFSDLSNDSSDAYVIDSSIKSSDEKFTYDLHESIPANLADKLENVSWEEERILRKVRLVKDKYGSFGLEVVEGCNGGLFVENVLKSRAEDDIDSIQRGDQLLSVNGICLLNMNYSEALNVLRNTGREIEILVSQSCRSETRQKPIEFEYLRNIRYDTALEVDNLESKIPAPRFRD